MFKPADPTKRRPSWLQSRTKENFIWQIAGALLILVGFAAKDWYEDRQFKKNVNNPIPFPK